MAIQSPLGIKGISQGIRETRKNVSASVATANSITKLVESRTKVSGDIFRRGSILRSRRLESSKRQEMEDEIEAGKLDVSTAQGAVTVAQRGSGGFLGRIMQAIAALGVGWLINNLPTWIAMGKEFIARIQRTGQILGGFVSNVISLLRGFGNVVGSLASNLSRFDLTDTSGKLQNSFSELELTLGSMGDQLQEGFKMLMSPLSEGVASGENAPATGSEAPDTLYPDVDSGGGASAGGGRWKPILDVIAGGESTTSGGYDAMYPGRNTRKEGKPVSEMTITEAAKYAGDRFDGKGNYAVGRYQFTTVMSQAKSAGLNPDKDLFSPANQDKMAVKIIEGKRRGRDWLSGKITDEQFGILLASEWAALKRPDGTGRYDGDGRNKASTGWGSVKAALGQVKKGSATPSTNINVTGTPNAGTRGVTTSVKDELDVVRNRSSLGGLTPGQGFGAPRRGRTHEGIDIGTYNKRGFYVAFRKSGKVVFAGVSGGYGNVVDIVTSDGTCYRFAHLAKMFVKNGDSYNGQTIGEIGNTGSGSGIHLHYEVRPGGPFGRAIDPKPYLGLLSIGRQLVGIAGQSATVQAPQLASTPRPSAQVSRSGQQSQAQRLASATSAPERKGEQIYLVNSGTTQQPMMAGSNQPSDVGMQISEFDLVNRFMKNKLLLDLAYL
jgi:murein DD-endopeptidase MepM/ murein hydrolase activator NlpD